MRMDYLDAVKSATNMIELLNLITLIKEELEKFVIGECSDAEYHKQLVEALSLAERRVHGTE